MVCRDFQFNGRYLSNYDMKVYDPETSQSFVAREIEKSDVSAVRPIANHYSTHYSDVLALDFLIIKDEDLCEKKNDMKMSGDNISRICAWLESPKTPTELCAVTGQSSPNTYYYGVFTNVQPFVLHQECYGLYLTFTCNAPYGFTPVTNKTIEIDSSSVSTSFNNLSCEESEYLYPTVTINAISTFGGDETIQICNESDGDKTMALTMPAGKSKVVINCRRKSVVDENGSLIPLSELGFGIEDTDEYNIISAASYELCWLGLIAGNNLLKVTSSKYSTISGIEISARFPKKAGGF